MKDLVATTTAAAAVAAAAITWLLHPKLIEESASIGGGLLQVVRFKHVCPRAAPHIKKLDCWTLVGVCINAGCNALSLFVLARELPEPHAPVSSVDFTMFNCSMYFHAVYFLRRAFFSPTVKGSELAGQP